MVSLALTSTAVTTPLHSNFVFFRFTLNLNVCKNGRRFIGFSVGVHSVFAALRGSPGDEAFSTRAYWLLTQCAALAVGMTHCRAEAMRSPSAALRAVPDRIDPC